MKTENIEISKKFSSPHSCTVWNPKSRPEDYLTTLAGIFGVSNFRVTQSIQFFLNSPVPKEHGVMG